MSGYCHNSDGTADDDDDVNDDDDVDNDDNDDGINDVDDNNLLPRIGKREWWLQRDKDGEEDESKQRQGNDKQQWRPSVHNNQTEYGGGKRETETVAATLVATG